MRFTFETDYDRKTLAVMAKCLRKTVRKAKSRRSRLLGCAITAPAILFPFLSAEDGPDAMAILVWLAAGVMIFALLFEDQINAFFAQKRMLKGTERATAIFDTDDAAEFRSETAVGKTDFSYDAILCVAETEGYFVFVLSANHAQIYDKSRLSGGTADEFRAFIGGRTGKAVVSVR